MPFDCRAIRFNGLIALEIRDEFRSQRTWDREELGIILGNGGGGAFLVEFL